MRVSYFCFFVAIFAALSGMGLGVYMGLAQDFALSPAHAHANLLGWVTMALYGLYHRGAASAGALVWVQAVCGAIGFGLMSGGLGVYLATHDDRFQPLIIVGSLCAVAGMLLFLAILIRDAARGRRGQPSLSRNASMTAA